MIVLGIDPGFATLGWGVIDISSSTPKAVAYGHISTSPKQPHSQRLLEIATDLEAVIAKYQPVEAGVEKLFFAANKTTAITVAEARGVILLTLERFQVSIAEYTPLQVKQAVTGFGRAEKHQMQEMVKGILKLPVIPKPDDVADALAIALCHASCRKFTLAKSSTVR